MELKTYLHEYYTSLAEHVDPKVALLGKQKLREFLLKEDARAALSRERRSQVLASQKATGPSSSNY